MHRCSVCSFPTILCHCEDWLKHSILTDGSLGSIFMWPVCNYLPCGRRPREAFLGILMTEMWCYSHTEPMYSRPMHDIGRSQIYSQNGSPLPPPLSPLSENPVKGPVLHLHSYQVAKHHSNVYKHVCSHIHICRHAHHLLLCIHRIYNYNKSTFTSNLKPSCATTSISQNHRCMEEQRTLQSASSLWQEVPRYMGTLCVVMYDAFGSSIARMYIVMFVVAVRSPIS